LLALKIDVRGEEPRRISCLAPLQDEPSDSHHGWDAFGISLLQEVPVRSYWDTGEDGREEARDAIGDANSHDDEYGKAHA